MKLVEFNQALLLPTLIDTTSAKLVLVSFVSGHDYGLSILDFRGIVGFPIMFWVTLSYAYIYISASVIPGW